MTGIFKVFWTENSVQDLIAIKSFISLDSSDRAETWVHKIFSAGENLGQFHLRGRIVPEYNAKNIRELLIENYRLVYRVNQNSIEILTVFEGHRQLNLKNINK